MRYYIKRHDKYLDQFGIESNDQFKLINWGWCDGKYLEEHPDCVKTFSKSYVKQAVKKYEREAGLDFDYYIVPAEI